VDIKEIKCPLQLWQKHENFHFFQFFFFVQQILGIIVGSQIETKRFFFIKIIN